SLRDRRHRCPAIENSMPVALIQQLLDLTYYRLQCEYLLGVDLSGIHLVHPLLEGNLDAELDVEGIADVQKCETVQPQIIGDMTVGCDLLARHPAFLHQHLRDCFKDILCPWLDLALLGGYYHSRIPRSCRRRYIIRMTAARNMPACG